MALASGGLLAVYFALAVSALLSSSDDPQRGMANGFIILVALVLLSIGGILWFAVARKHPWVARVVFVSTVFPALSWIAEQIFLFGHRGR
jgi:pimeloyl-ACP methyl ester carboxylesterase